MSQFNEVADPIICDAYAEPSHRAELEELHAKIHNHLLFDRHIDAAVLPDLMNFLLKRVANRQDYHSLQTLHKITVAQSLLDIMKGNQ